MSKEERELQMTFTKKKKKEKLLSNLEILFLIILVFMVNTVSANPDRNIDAKNIDLTKTVTLEELGYDSGKLSDLTLLINDPFVESEAIINLHIIKNPGSVLGNWDIKIYSNGVLVSRYINKKEGETWAERKIPTGCLDKGINEIIIESRCWEIILLEDSNITIIPANESTEKTLEDFGFETTTEKNSTIHLNSKIENPRAKLKLHYKKINPGGIAFGNWKFKVILNGVEIDRFVTTKAGEKWKEVEIPTGIIDKGDNTLKLESRGWPILLIEDSNFIIQESTAVQTATPPSTPELTAVPTQTPEAPTGEDGGIPGFEAVFAIVGLMAATYILMRNR
jgi:PGF-CTERM protein